MANKILVQDRFYGGLSEDEKEGIKASYSSGRSLDFRTNPSVLEILPKTAKESSTTVVDLVKWFTPVSTDMYSYGDGGKFYKRTSGASWSLIDTLTTANGNGMDYFGIDDYIYLAKDKVIARYGPMGGTPAITQDYFTDGTVDLDQFLDTSGSDYDVPTSISETATNRQTFFPQRDPQVSVQINVDTVGTNADWTVTVHDEANTSIATKTIANASMSTGDVTFTFATSWTPILGAEYHFHVTVDDTTGTPDIVSTTADDLETADFHTFYQILVTDTAFHPVKAFRNQLCIGNGRYIATFNGIPKEAGTTVYNPHRISSLPGDYKIRDLEVVGDYLVVVAVKSNTISEFDEGIIAFWDGNPDSADFNFYFQFNEGAVTAAGVEGNTLYFITSAGNLYLWNGEIHKLKKIPNMTQKTYIDTYPGAMTTWQGLVRIGTAGATNSSTVEQGVYSYGTHSDKYPSVLSYDYPISTGTRTATTLKIGAVGRIGDTLFIGWDDNGTYGVDTVTNSSNAFTTAVAETLIFDDERPYHDKLVKRIKANHEGLASGESVKLGYDIDRSGSFTQGSANSTASSKETLLEVNKRFHEIKLELTLGASTTSPTITNLSMQYGDLTEEEIF
jgi:hypothetical protein